MKPVPKKRRILLVAGLKVKTGKGIVVLAAGNTTNTLQVAVQFGSDARRSFKIYSALLMIMIRGG